MAEGPPHERAQGVGTVVAEILRVSRMVGITAQSHKVIGNLIYAVDRALGDGRAIIRGVPRPPDGQGVTLPWVAQARDNEAVVCALNGGARLVAGTAWLFAREDMDSRLDVLAVDEAGQYSLADAIFGVESYIVCKLSGELDRGAPESPGRLVESRDHQPGRCVGCPSIRLPWTRRSCTGSLAGTRRWPGWSNRW